MHKVERRQGAEKVYFKTEGVEDDVENDAENDAEVGIEVGIEVNVEGKNLNDEI